MAYAKIYHFFIWKLLCYHIFLKIMNTTIFVFLTCRFVKT